MRNGEKFEKKLLYEAFDLEKEDKELIRGLWKAYSKDKEELKEIGYIDGYIRDLKREINESIHLIHKGALRKSSEHISNLRGKIRRSAEFAGHLKKEQKGRLRDEKKVSDIVKRISKEIKDMNGAANKLAKELGIP